MRNILCYGDSNTWGFDAETKERFPADIRWTGILKKHLGDGYSVIEEGLNGRTTVWDDPIMGYKNGKEYLIPCLETHRPIDLVIIMLGTNDLKTIYSLSAFNIASGAGVLAGMVKKSDAQRGGNAPKVLLISPAEIGANIKETWLSEVFGESSIQTSKEFAKHYKAVADELGCEFLDAAQIVKPSPVDAVHLAAEEHAKLGAAVAEKIKTIFG
ncbi:SGNH/GDSL hydrolase family protein [Paenibacillus abyssi]|uniref:Hydrolase n=1 Tax=Paenibacillus abyssi TaxID=1340531 RepID=A0A917CN52_9BACL|nr:SGNH/GDSL hydrolase family protein [Paenibacillus abyssi]GGF93196.1 hydrolase [Paenibacillus abyssi]